MPDQTPEAPNANEGADPSADIKKQNPGKTTTDDLAQDDDSEASHERSQ